MTPVDGYIAEQSSPFREMMAKLDAILESCAPQMESKLTYNIPFYYYFGRLCYLNPKSDGIDLGFCRGAQMAPHPLLGRIELKEVRIIHYSNPVEIDDSELKPLIFEAMILNELTRKRKK